MRMIKTGPSMTRESAVYREIASNLDEIDRLQARNNVLFRAIIESVESEKRPEEPSKSEQD